MESTVLQILSKETAYFFFLFSMLNILHVFQFHAEVEIPQGKGNTSKGSDIICHMMCYFKMMG